MGLVDDKKSIFTEIGAYVSMNEQKTLPDPTNLFPSVNNKKDAVSYMLDLLKVTNGADALRNTVGDTMTKFVNNVEPSLKTALKKQAIQSNASNPVPTDAITNGITVPVSKIDIYGKYRNSPVDPIGNLTYGSAAVNFDKAAYSAIANPNTEVPYNNITITYNDVDDTFKFKPVVSIGQNIGDFLVIFITGLIVIDTKTFTTSILNSLYGTISTNQKKTLQENEDEVKTTVFIEKFINELPDIDLLPTEMFGITEKANNLMNGVAMLDVGCGVLQASLPLSGLTEAAQNLSGNTNPFQVTNQYVKTFDQSLATTQNTDVANNNRQAILDGFFTRLLHAIQTALAASVTVTPQIRTLMALSSYFSGGSVELGTPEEDFKRYRIFIGCLIKEAKSQLNEFIFGLVKTALIALVLPLAKKILKEKINNYIGIIRSLIGVKA